MKQMDADVIIVGSGLVGLVAAHSLSCLGLRTTVIEKKNFLETKTHLNDTRTTAVSEGSRLFLEDLHLWEKLKNYAEPIKEIKVFDRTPTNNISFTNEKGNKKLGYVIENRKFSTILRKELQSFRNTRILYGANIKNIHLTNAEAAIYTSKHKIKSKLIVAADGKNSDTKDIVGNKTFKKKYSENAMVLNFIHKKNLDGIAYEIFLKNGPLAILPMKQIKNNYQSTVIWSNNKNILR